MNSTDVLLLLRLTHVVGAILWGGTVISMALFILPAINASGPEGGKVMQQITKTNAFPAVINIAATLTILSGLVLIWNLSNGFQPKWLLSTFGVLLTTGGILGILAYAIGFAVNRPSVARMTVIGKEIAKSGGVPTPQQVKEIGTLRKKLFIATRLIASFLAITIIIMEMARYL